MEINGKTLGTCVLNDYFILFTHDSDFDRIYRIYKPDTSNISNTLKLFEGNLGFNINNKIQTLPFYENEKVQKVYWIDGLNQPRVINVVTKYGDVLKYTDTSFDFIQKLELNENVLVTKHHGGGYFKSGVIQYAFTYFNKNGSESNIFKTTNLNYISPIDRGGKVDEIIDNTFSIKISNLESKYDYVRIYSIYRTSLNSTPEVKSLIDININESNEILFIDNGSTGSIVSPDILLYVGGEELIPQCMSQKNNTLFLGNIKLKNNNKLPQSLETISPESNLNFSWIENNEIKFEGLSTENDLSYPYRPESLNLNNNIRHFKFDETYRLGIQGQYPSGKWSSPMWIGIDKTVDKRYKIRLNNNNVLLKKIIGKYIVSNELYNQLNSLDCNFINVRPIIVPLQQSDRTIIAQGILSNTLAIMKNRLQENIKSSKFSYPDYLFRTENTEGVGDGQLFNGRYNHFDILKINNTSNKVSSVEPNLYVENMANWDYWNPINIYDSSNLNGNFDKEYFFVDKNTVNFWSPEIIHNYDQSSAYIKNVKKIGLYGFAFPTGLNFKFSIDSGFDIDDKNIDKSILNYNNNETFINGFNYKKRIWTNVHTGNKSAIINFPIWSPEHYDDEDFDIQFTKLNKSSNIYFGINDNIVDPTFRYELNINSPSILINDSDIFYRTNTEDNAGNVIYSKYVEKNYPSNSFSAVYASSSTSNPVFAHKSKYGLSMKYNTANHAIFSFKKNNGYFSTIPKLQNTTSTLSEKFNSPYYRASTDEYSCDIINSNRLENKTMSYNASPIFDMYTDVVSDPSDINYSKYGGNSDDALYNNNWIPCGDSVKFEPNAVVYFTDGDTYIQRFDLLRVFPNDILQISQHTEIISFICESFVNLDGRSDVNRYNTDSSLMTSNNYGILNNVYSQKNNYFNYNILDPLLFNATKFNNSIIWSKTKVSGSINDTWTNLNTINSIDLDGIYGEVSSINLYNNNLYCFQPNAVARLLFNERVQQQSSDGVSLELANGYKIPEYRYLSNQYGCNNKWSIIEGKGGIYFIDYLNKSLMCINDGLKDISSTSGFKSWFNMNIPNRSYILSYDKINNDLYIHDETTCLNYSEILQSFVSFYDYVNVIRMNNIWDNFVSINYIEPLEILSEDSVNILESQDNLKLFQEGSNCSFIWINNKGEYNKFYGEQKPFHIEYILNPDPLNDKTFNTIEYRLNDQFIDWNNVEITNWYQYGNLNNMQYLNNLKRKFNVNRVQLPRQSKVLDNSTGLIDFDTKNSLNRIRSTWAKLKISHEITSTNINKKFDMQDLTVTYTV